MDPIIQKTRELGELLLESEECKRMRMAEAEAMNDPEASMLIEKYNECKIEVQNLLIEENPDSGKLQLLSNQMDAYQDRLAKIDSVLRLTQAQMDFSKRIEQVNATLRFIITGDTGQSECGGNCAHCSGCH
ncbi:MAG: YlbF family regulator [Clostridia bacterium]|nr:YlbF family regulator [Clostridia bacterium]